MIEFLSPVWSSTAPSRATKRRPHDLRGARIALVDDNLDIPFTTELLRLLDERAGAKVHRLVKPSGTAPSPPDLIAGAADEAAAAVVGIGL